MKKTTLHTYVKTASKNQFNIRAISTKKEFNHFPTFYQLNNLIMLVTNFKVFITKNGDGAITYTKRNMKYKVFLTKKDPVITEIFNKYYSQLKHFKNRHYAIAQWIVRDIRAKRYVFKAYSNNNRNIRPVLLNKDNRLITNELIKKQIKENLDRQYMEDHISEFERLTH